MGAGVEHTHKPGESERIVEGQLGRVIHIGLFPLAEIGKWITVRNRAELKEKCGPIPAVTDACFNDYWNAYMALRNGVGYITLLIWNTAHYSDYTDPDTLTATQSSIELLDADGTCTLEITDRRYGLSDMEVKVLAGSIDSTSYFDLEIYFSNTGKTTRVNNCSMTTTSENYVAKQVGTTRIWKIADKGVGTRPVNITTAVPLDTASANVTVGSNGWTGLDQNDFIGTESVKGNTGVYAISSFENTLLKPEHIMIPYKFTMAADSETADLVTMLTELETWAETNEIVPILGTPSGLNRDQVADYRRGEGSYSTAFGTEIGGGLMLWPWGTPSELMTSQDTVTGLPPRISPEGVKAGALARCIKKDWIHQAAAGFDYGETGFAELERDTDMNDHNVLDALGIQTILASLGNIIWGHYSLSRNPKFLHETVRRQDNLHITSINVATMPDVSRPASVNKLKGMGRKMRMYFRSNFKTHPNAYRYATFEESVFVDVEGQNDRASDAFDAGDIFTAWDTIYAPNIHKIRHQYDHSRERFVTVGG